MKNKRIVSLILAAVLLCSSAFFNVSVSAKRSSTLEISKKYQKILDEKTDKLIKEIPEDMTDYEKALYVYLKMSAFCVYDCYELESFTAYGAIVTGIAQCEGYANGFSYILDKLNIPNRVVTSYKINHSWNLVRIDGKWYHCDPTGETLEGFMIGNKSAFSKSNAYFKNYYSFSGKADWFVDDGRKKVSVSAENYQKAFDDNKSGASVLSDIKDVNTSSLFADNGYIYYQSKAFKGTVKLRGNQRILVVKNIAKTNKEDNYNLKAKCGDNFYYVNLSGDYDKWTSYNANKNEYKSGKLNKNIFWDINIVAHDLKNHNVKATYSTNGTKERKICKDCGNIIDNNCFVVEPLKIKVKPKIKLSNKKKGKVTCEFTNRFYKQTSATYKKCGGYQISYKRKGTSYWRLYNEVLSSKKDVKRILNLKSGKKYYIRARYVTAIGIFDYSYENRNQYGPWSSAKLIKVK